MELLKKRSTYLIIFLVIFACFLQESESVRPVLRGRRTLTRRYFTGLAIPGWALVLCIAIGELILGGALYLVMQRVILSKEVEQSNTYVPAPTKETNTYNPAPTNAA